ncbi:single-stranded DNA-binding protein [Arthrobacter globiformis NBRC 12137]|uniref:Single-stranded DNA-binding protein n=1 Tax=Arthrobacter globiformis (strain ATCC 8010 / DSM 20124 / JCM 1332 / NBRC 12137 / NCIMB 8907 / NRRL B-2979 / 168) TaxID=1077972 RepID=H0QPD0_ARTG1|nr:single-stranded DNA-binding protein [Arthrobacter globiformis]GAB14681.1 single-stranded DNA-binding protein [Arthrobacter globiformis NBRC 12137]
MTDTITVRGFVATEIRSSTTPGGVPTASFRLGSAERRYDRTANAWVDGNINWFTVQGYRQLAGNMGCSIKKGQRVIIVGKLKMRSWEKDGRVYHDAEIDADAVGHDLKWGTANFIRNSGNPHAADAFGSANGDRSATGSSVMDGDGADEDREEDDESDEDPAAAGIFVDGAGDEMQLDAETGELTGAAA